MKFDLNKPCDGCPFLKVGGVKGLRRAREIAMAMASPQVSTFACHKTLDYCGDDGESRETPGTQHCAGGLAFMEKVNPSGTQMVRIMERLGMYDRRKLQGHELVFDSVAEMVRANR